MNSVSLWNKVKITNKETALKNKLKECIHKLTHCIQIIQLADQTLIAH